MQKRKLRLGQLWPEQIDPAKPDHEGGTPDTVEPAELLDEGDGLGVVADERPMHTSRTSKNRGSYCLRRGWTVIVRSAYLTRVLAHLARGYKEGGEDFLSDLALVWISNDGSREYALKGRPLRELAVGME